MPTPWLRPISYRHVVFPDLASEGGRALNFTPPLAQPSIPELSDDELSGDEHDCIRWLFERAGLRADDYRRETIKRRMPACLRALRVETPAQLRARIQRDVALLKPVLNALMIGVTAFFRDPSVFQTLDRLVLDELLSRAVGPGIWSAGCSDGSELYSVAMLLAERGAMQRCTLLGTDCRSNAVSMAREACYDASSLRNVPGKFFDQYFRFDDGGWRIHPYLRAIIQWRCGNVLAMPEPGSWDLILGRNLAIYMQPSAAARLWMRLVQCLRPGGFLVVGKAERPLGECGLKLLSPCIYRRERSCACRF
jgi:chemotaxis methyl-accepting protein methylase